MSVGMMSCSVGRGGGGGNFLGNVLGGGGVFVRCVPFVFAFIKSHIASWGGGGGRAKPSRFCTPQTPHHIPADTANNMKHSVGECGGGGGGGRAGCCKKKKMYNCIPHSCKNKNGLLPFQCALSLL